MMITTEKLFKMIKKMEQMTKEFKDQITNEIKGKIARENISKILNNFQKRIRKELTEEHLHEDDKRKLIQIFKNN